ncbi:ATP phosphoribosyltransferase regulatory subunit [Geobacter pelophilus]|uniref:ATP phosphoribosyltransferase regulatory subunit n=1 Tax=Geoanaerobacter pelophilus TaxID=60036 RepID=A0AAW4LCQ0_9BACT|nr:ATP phosphoribosyltransferase regulatory subunit [Geoanaerobacter pelophilus]MBT0664946.1 ATP phosphoribosyltransferase regulatory subunit [Geoanaerobacter pelophilus]
MYDPNRIDAQLPRGVTDFLPDIADKIGHIQGRIQRVFESWGFRRIMTPMLEFEDVLALGMGEGLRSRTFRFDDRQSGRMLAVPPDITPQVARIVATRMRGLPFPHRLSYLGRVLRHAEIQSGRSREILQAGVELIGLESPEADAEMIAMAIEALQSLGFEDFKLDIGQVEFFRGIMDAAALDEETTWRIKSAIGKKDVSAIGGILNGLQLSDTIKEAIASLPRLFGDRRILAEAERVAVHERSRKALSNIEQVLEILDLYGLSQYLTIDLGEIRGLDYHTGITFEGFVAGFGEAVCSGGRYDQLMERYGCPAPATGFAFNILSLMSALERQPDVQSSVVRDFLLFNAEENREEVLKVAKCLREMGYSAVRDIIRRDYASSLEYARQAGIRRMLVVGGGYSAPDELYIVSAADGSGFPLKKADLFNCTGRFDFDRFKEKLNG